MNDMVSSRKTGGLAWSVTVPSLAGGERRLLAFSSQFSVFSFQFSVLSFQFSVLSSQYSDFAGWVRACSVLRGALFHSFGRSAPTSRELASQRVSGSVRGVRADRKSTRLNSS